MTSCQKNSNPKPVFGVFFMSVHKANKKGWGHYLLIGSAMLPILLFIFIDLNPFGEKEVSAMQIISKNPLILLPLLAPFGLFLWVYLTTQYQIKDAHIHYRSAFLKGQIPVANVRKIVKGKTLWVGLKPALATKGLIIYYNRFDEIYIAPESNDKMISELLAIHPDIEIVEA